MRVKFNLLITIVVHHCRFLRCRTSIIRFLNEHAEAKTFVLSFVLDALGFAHIFYMAVANNNNH